MDNRDVFEVQAGFALDILNHNLRMLASTVGQKRFPRFVRKMRAQLEHFLVLIDAFETQLLEDSERESDAELANSAELLKINCYEDDEDEPDESREWARTEWEEHQLLLTELTEEEEEFYTATKFRCKVLRIKVRLLLNRLGVFEQMLSQQPTSPHA
jgi:hypothetical protein